MDLKELSTRLFHFLGENVVPLQYAVFHDPGAKFDGGDSHENFTGKYFAQQSLNGRDKFSFIRRGVVGIEFVEAGPHGRVFNEPGIEQSPNDENKCRDQKYEPSRVCRACVNREKVAQEILKSRGRRGQHTLGSIHDRLSPIEGEINADGNERAEYRAEDPALTHVEPVGFNLYD